ncbi:MAG: hypothetical protein KAH32_00430 [Chlamydiia bacterium]|nr:hypothetical protein [Chlamydiia bacterium]
MHNSGNSSPRKGFGQSNTHKCPNCKNEMRFTKLPFMFECSGCRMPIMGSELIEIKKEENE